MSHAGIICASELDADSQVHTFIRLYLTSYKLTYCTMDGNVLYVRTVCRKIQLVVRRTGTIFFPRKKILMFLVVANNHLKPTQNVDDPFLVSL